MKQLFLLSLLLFTVTSFAQTLQENMWITNGTVNAVQRADNTVYIAGDFSAVGARTPYGGVVSTVQGAIVISTLRPNGIVHAVAPDGSGGWYIGGEFTQVGGRPRNRLARINADGSLHSWNPNVSSGAVFAIATHTNRVYVGGGFSQIGGQTRRNIAALTTTTGSVTSWDPNVSGGRVEAIAVPETGNTVYIGGTFNFIGDQQRRAIGAINQTTGVATAWNPEATQFDGIGSAPVYALAVEGDIVYAGGGFQRIGGLPRFGLAALNRTTGAAYASWEVGGIQVWDINGEQSPVRTLAVVSGAGGLSTLYVGGDFIFSIGRHRLFAVSTFAAGPAGPISSLLSWAPNANGPVRTLQVVGTTLYAAGWFTEIGGQSRRYIAALDRTGDGNATSWYADADWHVHALAVDGSRLYAGGSFFSLGMRHRDGLAALDATTGVLTPWNPVLNGFDHAYYTLAVDGSTVYAGGRHRIDGGAPLYPPVNRARMVALNRTNADIRWARSMSTYNDEIQTIYTFALDGNTLYAAGSYRLGPTNYRILAVNATTGNNIVSFNSAADGIVRSLAVVDNNLLMAGGEFHEIGGQIRFYIAALLRSNGAATAWLRYFNNDVHALAVKGNTVFVGGDFTDIGGVLRNRVAAIDVITGDITPWSIGPGANGRVSAFAIDEDVVYAAGSFTQIGGQDRNYVAALSASLNGVIPSWNADVSPFSSISVGAVAVGGNSVYTGGNFFGILGQSNRRNFAALSKAENPLPVRWISFEGRLDEQNLAVLDWATEEANVSHYQVERSSNARDFRAIATVPARGDGAGQYRFTDPTAVSGNTYYRIRQVDRDGTFSHSPAISLPAQSLAVLRAYPNPARGAITVELGAELVGSRARLVSTAGVVLQEVTVKETVFSISLEGYPAGMYLLHTEDGKVAKVVKE